MRTREECFSLAPSQQETPPRGAAWPETFRASDRAAVGKEYFAFLFAFLFNLLIVSLPSSSAISLDKLLDAGLYTGEVTEIVGAPGSGKTQVYMRPAAWRIGDAGSKALDPWGPSASVLVGWELRRERMSEEEWGLDLAPLCHWNLDKVQWGAPVSGPL